MPEMSGVEAARHIRGMDLKRPPPAIVMVSAYGREEIVAQAEAAGLDGFLVKPLGWQEGKKYPMILNIHGGPAGMYGVDWFHEFQVYAARGWAVFYTNPRGSTGYGESSKTASSTSGAARITQTL
jgi:dipeptidyl aminopeptidase/acylaminoacyl peptidase